MKLVVLGLGQVGIPLAAAFASQGHEVVGVDIDPGKVEAINGGTNPLPTREEALDDLIGQVVESGSLRSTDDYASIGEAEAVFVCVDTPVDAEGRPDYTALRSVLAEVGRRLSSGTLVSIESTLAPGTMQDLVRPLLEEKSGLRAHEDIHLVHCPERVTSGKLLHNLTTLDRVVGGDPTARAEAIALYQGIGQGAFLETDWTSAELSKTVENAYRDVQLAFANEVALLCEAAGVDAYEVRELVNSSPGRAMLRPGPGVGGHCLSKDSLLLAAAAKNDGVHLLTAARTVNEGMLEHVVALVEEALGAQGGSLSDATIVLMGAAYKANVADTPNSPALALAPVLERKEATVRIHDPYVPEKEGIDVWRDLTEAAQGTDCLVLVTDHDVYRDVDWRTLGEGMRRRLVADCRGALDKDDMVRNGFAYVGLGRGRGTS